MKRDSFILPPFHLELLFLWWPEIDLLTQLCHDIQKQITYQFTEELTIFWILSDHGGLRGENICNDDKTWRWQRPSLDKTVCSHWPELENLAFPQPCHSKPGVSELQHRRGWDGLTWVKPGSGPGLGREGIAHLIGPGGWQLHSQGGLQRVSNRLGFYCRQWGEEVPFSPVFSPHPIMNRS